MIRVGRDPGNRRSTWALPATLLVLPLGVALAGLVRTRSEAAPPPPPADRTDAAPPRWLGAGSCAARGCHGGVGGGDPARGDVAFAGGEYATWRTYDPHARAFRSLQSERSQRMAQLLAARLGGRPAHEAPACLSCHEPRPASTIRPEPEVDLTRHDGVGCESCHGPAAIWRDLHLTTSWRAQPPELKAKAGLTDLESPAGRASSCVGCHVGDRSTGREVDHDFLAAGHPRLNFEVRSSLAALPRHWHDRDDPTAAARSWALGQAVVAQAGVNLLASRATAAASNPDRPGPWPELSEYGCFACHRDLPTLPDAPTSPAGQSPLPWATWTLATLPSLAATRPEVDPESPRSVWFPLRAAMVRDEPNPTEVARLAESASRAVGSWVTDLCREPFDAGRVDALLRDLVRTDRPDRVATWDGAAQRYLAVRALTEGQNPQELPPGVRQVLELAPKLLTFPDGFDSPRRFQKSPASAGPAATGP